ncbi:hypothetical protein F2P81_011349 [Scophthalmus maximus]|uniref:Uncharacterized protein n=1 Tax=Scophthalmus maximus TaxID=52904 RepID=A0A6A4SRK8_SCOMX|nr:hypothetical protein F2P81_011349 [Scophthalmus maximus]
MRRAAVAMVTLTDEPDKMNICLTRRQLSLTLVLALAVLYVLSGGSDLWPFILLACDDTTWEVKLDRISFLVDPGSLCSRCSKQLLQAWSGGAAGGRSSVCAARDATDRTLSEASQFFSFEGLVHHNRSRVVNN